MERVVGSVAAQPQVVHAAPNTGTVSWILGRLTAYGLLVFLTVHMIFNYYLDLRTGNQLTFEVVNRRFYLYPVIYAFNDIGLLTCTLYHGLNGVQSVVNDVVTSHGARRLLTAVLLLIGLFFLYDGSKTLIALMYLKNSASGSLALPFLNI
ncbi:MAG: hypothetical protein NVS4B8_29540 [Herpetosiphon sp.]